MFYLSFILSCMGTSSEEQRWSVQTRAPGEKGAVRLSKASGILGHWRSLAVDCGWPRASWYPCKALGSGESYCSQMSCSTILGLEGKPSREWVTQSPEYLWCIRKSIPRVSKSRSFPSIEHDFKWLGECLHQCMVSPFRGDPLLDLAIFPVILEKTWLCLSMVHSGLCGYQVILYIWVSSHQTRPLPMRLNFSLKF